MCFATACLSICKDSPIEAIEQALDYILHTIIHIHLLRFARKCSIECEFVSRLLSLFCLLKPDCFLILVIDYHFILADGLLAELTSGGPTLAGSLDGIDR